MLPTSMNHQEKNLQRKIRRIESRRLQCEAVSRTFSWLRLTVVLLGGVLTWVSGVQFGPPGAWAVFIFFLFVFVVIVSLHRRIDRWQLKFSLWRSLQTEQLARLTLDWVRVPAPAAPSPALTPLAVDLDLTGERSLHHLLDMAVTRQGSLRLAEWLTAGAPDLSMLNSRQRLVSELKAMPRFSQRFILSYRLVSQEPLDADHLLAWLHTPLQSNTLNKFLPLASALAGLNLAFFLLNLAGYLPAFWLLSGLAYLGLYIASQRVIGGFLDSVLRLDQALERFHPLLLFIERSNLGRSPQLAELCAPFIRGNNRPSIVLRQVKWITAAVGLRMNPVLGFILNMIVPWDFWVAWLAASQRTRLSRLLPSWLDCFHDLEALISLGNFAHHHPDYAFPDISFRSSEQPVFSTRQMGHPLLSARHRVPNDFHARQLGEIQLITGSNMAGKSTFIRAIGINMCLAFAGGPVCAASLTAIPFRLYTCIRVTDSLADGFSYFYAEVRRLKGLLDAVFLQEKSPHPPLKEGFPVLYLIDEIFRGTNNRERLAGSRAFVKALIGSQALGFIATHDLELAAFAESYTQVHNFHFRDTVQDGKLAFDFLIRPGPSPTTNALRIMALEGLPVENPESP